MKIKLFQINTDRDKDGKAFLSTRAMETIFGEIKADSSIYDEVFEGQIENCGDLEEIYEYFNRYPRPEHFIARSMSVSDVVKVEDGNDEVPEGFYYCDSIGFRKMDFDETKVPAREGPEMIDALLIYPGGEPQKIKMISDERELQKMLGAGIKALPVQGFKGVSAFFSDKAEKNRGSANRALYSGDGKLKNIIYGPLVLCEGTAANPSSLSRGNDGALRDRFRYPEVLRINENGEKVMRKQFTENMRNNEYEREEL